MAQQDRRIVLGAITGAHGIRGEVKLISFTADPLAIGDYGSLEGSDGRSYQIEAVRIQGTGLVARLEGVQDRNRAEALKGVELSLDRARLPAPEEGEFYHADLIGLRAVTVSGETLGLISGAHNFGAGDLLEVRLGAGGRSVLIPFTDACVREIDLAAGTALIDPPPGLLGEGEDDDERGEAPRQAANDDT